MLKNPIILLFEKEKNSFTLVDTRHIWKEASLAIGGGLYKELWAQWKINNYRLETWLWLAGELEKDAPPFDYSSI